MIHVWSQHDRTCHHPLVVFLPSTRRSLAVQYAVIQVRVRELGTAEGLLGRRKLLPANYRDHMGTCLSRVPEQFLTTSVAYDLCSVRGEVCTDPLQTVKLTLETHFRDFVSGTRLMYVSF